MNMDYCLSELKALLSIDSPSGFTDKAADYLIGELTALGYAPEKTRKGGVFCCLGGNVAVIAVGKRGEIVKARRHGDALAGRGDKRNVNGVCAAVFGVAIVWIGDIHRIRTYLPELKLRAHRTVSVPYLQTQTAARKLVLSGKQLMATTSFYSFEDYIYNIYPVKDKVTFVGYPSESGEPGNSFYIQCPMAISSVTKYPDAAWDFVSTMIRQTNEDAESMYAFPISQEAFDKKMTAVMTEQYQLDENGEQVDWDEDGEPDKMSIGSYEVVENGESTWQEVYALTQEDIDQILSVINSATGIVDYDEEILSIVSDEVKRLSRLVRTMLNLSRIDNGELKLRPNDFDISETVLSTVLTFEKSIDEKKIDIRGLDTLQPMQVHGDEDLLHQVVYNLVENAVKFTNTEGYISFNVSDSIDRIVVTIENSGSGIQSDELPLVFEKFYKTDKSRSQDKNGMGLGLYLVRTIIKLHGGDISVSSVVNEYTRFSFYIPKPQEPPKLKYNTGSIPVTVPVEDAVISERPKKEHHGHKDNKEPDQK